MNFKVVIPARLGSTRLPRKVLADVHGKPLIEHVWKAASLSGADEIVVATDNAEVEAACRLFGADVAMTDVALASGTDRAHAVAAARAWSDDTLIVNLQGDEPLMPPALLARAARLLAEDAASDIATLCHPLRDESQWRNPNVVKVVLDETGHALYFSRAPVPWLRAGADGREAQLPPEQVYRHLGIYAYRAASLARFSALPPAALERIEALEQLRALSAGMRIAVGISQEPPPQGVDTAEDLEFVRKALRRS